MPDLLFELFSEEIPARMQAKAADDLRRMVTDKLVAEGLVYEGAKAFATPRRLTLTVHGIPARQSDLKEERKGPRVGGPEAAIAGFLKATGLASLDEAKIQRDPKKGDFYIALIEKPGRATLDVLADMLPVIIRTFPWPKSMRWGERSAKSSALQWVRPLHAIVATFGLETETPDIVNFAVDGIEAGQTIFGHRFMAPAPIAVRRFEDYEAKLLDAKVVLDPQRRKDTILTDARQLAFAQGFELVEDQVLLDEVSGLVEWPVVLMGSFDKEFLSIPGEVIRATIRNNQKCFVVNDPKTGKLTNKFILTANIEASDGGKAIIAGNERVIRARLSDAKFFYETDLKTKLEDRLPKFENIVFHEKLGTQGERIKRIERLAAEIAPLVGADVEKTKRAAHLAKADLLTEVVGEFPELQGLMGKYYALAQGEDASVAAASEEHYKPQGPNDRVPTDPVSVAVALADKLDTLIGFWAIDEKPTGSKDPYALRRAALGIIRLIVENNIRIKLMPAANKHILAFVKAQGSKDWNGQQVDQKCIDLLSFFADRLKGQLREQGARHDLVDAVFAEGQDDLLMVVRRVEALGRFLDTDDGKNLLAGTKRAANILRIEEKKDGKAFDGTPDAALYSLAEEKSLAKAINQVKTEASAAVAQEDFAGAMSAMAKLRPAVDAFFDKVKVNDDDPKVRENRLKLLNEIRAATRAVADFSKIQDRAEPAPASSHRGGFAVALPELTPENAFIFRIIHKDNLAWILDNGLHSRKSLVKDPHFVNIGLADLIEKRHLRRVPKPPGGTLSDYIPFYFTPLSIMAYNIHTGHGVKQRGNDEIIILVSSLVGLQKTNVSFLFTDRHAATLEAKFSSDLSGLSAVDWKILQNRDFSRDNDDISKTSRYQAEALVHDKMSTSNLIRVACCDDNQRKWAGDLVKQRGLTLEVTTTRGWYF